MSLITRLQAFNFNDPLGGVFPNVDGTITIGDRSTLWGYYYFQPATTTTAAPTTTPSIADVMVFASRVSTTILNGTSVAYISRLGDVFHGVSPQINSHATSGELVNSYTDRFDDITYYSN